MHGQGLINFFAVNGSVQIQSQEANHQQLPIMAAGRIHFWPGDDRMHHVPQGFKWPMSKNTMVIWNYWFSVKQLEV